MGVDVMLVGPLPTPGIAFITESMRADAGVVVSASHNLFEDNGIKIFGHDGFKLPDEVEHELESLIFGGTLQNLRPTGELIGKAKRIDDAAGRYIVYLKTRIGKDKLLDGLKVVVDCGHGAAYKVAPEVFRELGAEVIALNVEPDGTNINRDCGSMHPEQVRAAVLEKKADLGIALDGDADRVVLVDEKGQIVDGDAIIALLATELKVQGELKHNTVVATEMSNLGLEKCLTNFGIKLERTQVGDRYVVERMRAMLSHFGGESSGHLIFLEHGTTGDGVAAALKIVMMQRDKGVPLSKLVEIFEPSARAVRNIVVAKRVPFAELKAFSADLAKMQAQIGTNGRIFVRYSGTELKARILVETDNQEQATHIAEQLTKSLVSDLQQK